MRLLFHLTTITVYAFTLFACNGKKDIQPVQPDSLFGTWQLKDIDLPGNISDPELKMLMEIEKEYMLENGFALTLNQDYTGSRHLSENVSDLTWRINDGQDTVFLLATNGTKSLPISQILVDGLRMEANYSDSGRFKFEKSTAKKKTDASPVVESVEDNDVNVVDQAINVVTAIKETCDKPPYQSLNGTKKVVVLYLTNEQEGSAFPSSPDARLLSIISSGERFQKEIIPLVSVVTYGIGCPEGNLIASKFGIRSVPVVLVIDDNETVVSKSIGLITESTLIENIKTSLDL